MKKSAGVFKKLYPRGVSWISTRRELDASWQHIGINDIITLYLRQRHSLTCTARCHSLTRTARSLPAAGPKALDKLATWTNGKLAAVNTSQTLPRMHVLRSPDIPMMCLTFVAEIVMPMQHVNFHSCQLFIRP